MRKLILIFIPVLMLLAAAYFMSGWGKPLRQRVISACDKDIIHLNDDTTMIGWIWNQSGDRIDGQTVEEKVFALDRTEYKRIEKDFLFKALKQLL